MKMIPKIICLIFIGFLTINLISAIQINDCQVTYTDAKYSENLKNITIEIDIFTLDGRYVKSMNATFRDGYFQEDIFIGNFCINSTIDRGAYYSTVKLDKRVTNISGNLNHTFYNFPFECNIEYIHEIKGSNEDWKTIKVDFINNFDYMIPMVLQENDQIRLSKSNVFASYIEGNVAYVVLITNETQVFNINPHNMISLTGKSKFPSLLEKNNHYFSVILAPRINDSSLIPVVCQNAKSITYSVVLPQKRMLIYNLEVFPIGESPTISKSENDKLIYSWTRNANESLISTAIVQYKYITDWISVIGFILAGLFGFLLDRFLPLILRLFGNHKKTKVINKK